MTKAPVKNDQQVSVSPSGEVFPLPTPADYNKELKRLQTLVKKHRREGREIVVVMGVGFVGAVMAGVVADSVWKESGVRSLKLASGGDFELKSQTPGNIAENFGKGVSETSQAAATAATATTAAATSAAATAAATSAASAATTATAATAASSSPSSAPVKNANFKDLTPGFPNKFVIGMQRPSPRSYWKIPLLNRGIAPVESEDPEVAPLIARCVLEKKTLTATFTYDALSLADVVVVDVQCDYFKETLGNCRQGHADIAALEESLKVIGERIPPDCLVLIETTVPPGTTEYVAYPIIKKAFEKRGLMMPAAAAATAPIAATAATAPTATAAALVPAEPLLAHSYERVMPGREYVSSIRDFWRVCSGTNATARARVARFLSEVLNVEKYPLTVLDRPIESETCKIVE
ncbi:MAG TPA: hypothetical protein PLS43_10070, partial [Syntrophales bacterium]|nr:hypothetical protein [Syntrophales bacterium]